MTKDYKDFLIQAKMDQKIYKKMLKNLKRKNVDIIFQKYHEEVFRKVDCLSCANCCITTGPLIMDRDIARISKALRMKPADFEAKYLRIDEDCDWVFRTMPCPFLGSDNYCLIYEDRPKACREYPHTDSKNMYRLFEKTLINSTLCPAVALILKRIGEREGNKAKGSDI